MAAVTRSRLAMIGALLWLASPMSGIAAGGSLVVRVPRDARVRLNDGAPAAASPNTPFRATGLTPAIYRVRAETAESAWVGYIEVFPGQEASVTAVFPTTPLLSVPVAPVGEAAVPPSRPSTSHPTGPSAATGSVPKVASNPAIPKDTGSVPSKDAGSVPKVAVIKTPPPTLPPPVVKAPVAQRPVPPPPAAGPSSDRKENIDAVPVPSKDTIPKDAGPVPKVADAGSSLPTTPTPAPRTAESTSPVLQRVEQGRDWTAPSVEMAFVWIKALGVWAGQYEVTNREFKRFRPAHRSGDIQGLSLDDDDQPVVNVSFKDAVAFADWLTSVECQAGHLAPGLRFRLPDHQEWRALAQCGEGRTYPWGQRWPPTAGNYADQSLKRLVGGAVIGGYDDGFAASAPVARSGANAWGLHGLGGNAVEWTTETLRLQRGVRGGGWRVYSGQRPLTCDYREARAEDARAPDLGFRLVLAPVQP